MSARLLSPRALLLAPAAGLVVLLAVSGGDRGAAEATPQPEVADEPAVIDDEVTVRIIPDPVVPVDPGLLTEWGIADRGVVDDAARRRDDAMMRLRAAERDIIAAEERLLRLQGELGLLEEAIEAATARQHTAAADVLGAQREAEEAAARIDAADAAREEAVARLGARAATVYKHGTTRSEQQMFALLARTDDPHDVSISVRVYDRVLREDRAVVAEATAAIEAAREAHERAEQTARDAAFAEDLARSAVAELYDLRVEQAELTALAREERGQQRTRYAELARDVDVAALIAARLTEQVAAYGPGLPAGGDEQRWMTRLPASGRAWADPIAAAARRHGVDPALLAALVWTESGFRPSAVSPAGAIGLTQLMPDTARSLGVDPRDPRQNLDGGARYLRQQLDRFGRVDLALAAYNAGPNRVAAAGGVPDILETRLYVSRVLERRAVLAG